MMVDGINKIGIAMPETTPKSAKASDSDTPVWISIAGNKTAIAELTSEPLARTEVIGRVALNSGFKDFFGVENFPP